MRKSPKRPVAKSVPELPDMGLDALDTTDRVINYCVKHNLINGLEVDIEKVIEMNPDLSVAKKPLADGIDAYIKQTQPGKYEIGVNSKHSKTRQRFSMAHEFAHYQLHRNKLEYFSEGERILHRSDERNTIEYQANSFAAEVLMPESMFRAEVKKIGGNIAELAKSFGVSQLALRYRAKGLGMRGHGV